MKKRILALMMAATIGLTGCGVSNASTENQETTAEASEDTEAAGAPKVPRKFYYGM